MEGPRIDVEQTGLGTSESHQPGWKAHILAFAFYLGLGPLLNPLAGDRHDPYLRHHYSQALAVLFLFMGGIVGILAVWSALSFLLVYDLAFLPYGTVEKMYWAVIFLWLGLWLVLWVLTVGLALAGSRRNLPGIARLAQRAMLIRLSAAGCLIAYGSSLLVLVLAVHASSLCRHDGGPAQAYMLYDDMGFLPRWLFSLGFYRVSLAAQEHWGADQVKVMPLTEETWAEAVRQGKFVFVASHGARGYIVTPDLCVGPDEARRIGKGNHLQFLYLAACDSGLQATQWQQAVDPAEVKTFGRTSAVAEHLLWLWQTGPERLQQLSD